MKSRNNQPGKAKKESKIVNIGIEQIYPHPENPRKNVGDVSELAESIKKNGIMQNLTVIPGHWNETGTWIEKGYTLIIGHRRHAAAMAAGVEELPCRVIVGLSRKEQLSTMLEENMQRSDLTIFEQAQGFQLMLDLSDTEEQIAEKTGFSRTTIRHRLKLAELDQELLKDKEKDESFQLTLKDLYELEKIKDPKLRDEVLKKASNSREIAWRAQEVAKEEKRKRNEEYIVELLTEMGLKRAPKKAADELWSGKWKSIEEMDLDKDPPKEIALKHRETLVFLRYYNRIKILQKSEEKKKKKSEYEIEQEQREQARKELKSIAKEMAAVREEFVLSIISGKTTPLKDETELKDMIWKTLICNGQYIGIDDLMKFYLKGNSWEWKTEEKEETAQKIAKLSVAHQMLIVLLSKIKQLDFTDYSGYFNEKTGKIMQMAHKVLGLYGFTVDEEINQIISGTHRLYRVREEKQT